MERTLGIIPARGGSKSLPGKNIMNIAGEPLIYWTIKAAKCSKLLSHFVISTDDPEIKKTSESAGGNVPFLRPKELAGDQTSSVDVVLHCIEYFEEQNTHFDNVILLEPTSPMRKVDDIDNALRLFYNNYGNIDGIVSVGKIHLENPAVVKYIKGNLIFPISVNGSVNKISRRQDYPEFYFPYGVLYIIKTDILKEKGSFYTNRIMPYFIERWQNYELDDIYDFYSIESIMRKKIKEGVL
jgi:CMP-N,N'-diacetyllegionaminic acid synthase